ncbi:drug-metabolite transporter superfamily protein [Fictibacillus macauensis ZFHKF-1]|uniref:Drug-metabolite transporter superfamily protein n=1 Tax=Fictibacillus macauensis ZFHKF-1 TaxID=1196324 RepID=I8AFA3_9BACL|nr:DMT family transporter [Fictibacillus macauensis]EIT84312.1 drug-metabolite transporter superfamily protein [Fictibacillus macauensis ZFHKF-1]
MYYFVTLLAASCYAGMTICMKIASQSADGATMTFVRYGFSFLIVLLLYGISGKPPIKTSVLPIHMLRSVLGVLMFGCYAWALRDLPVSNALSLNAAYPLFLPFLLFFFYREPLKLHRFLLIGLGFIGMIVIVRPQMEDYNLVASLVAILSAICSACANLTVQALRKTEASYTIVFYFFLLASLGSFGWMLATGIHVKNLPWLPLLGVALFGVLSQQLLSYVLKYLHATVVSMIMNSSIMVGMLGSWMVWGEQPRVLDVLGALILIASMMSLSVATKGVKAPCNKESQRQI